MEMAKPEASKNKLKSVKKLNKKTILLAQIGRLQLERETHAARLEDTNQRMNAVRQKLILIIKNKKGEPSCLTK
jgi:hypothetical protein